MSALEQPDLFAATRQLPVEQMEATLADLQAMRAMLDEQIDLLRRLLDTVSGKQRYPRKRDAVLDLLEERGTEMPLAQIRAHLVARGAIPATKKAAHALQMMLSTLVNEGYVERVSQGIYRIEQNRAGHRLREALTPYEGGLFTELANPTSGSTEEVRQGGGETP